MQSKRSLLINGKESKVELGEISDIDKYCNIKGNIDYLKKELETLGKKIIKDEKLEVGDELVSKEYRVKLVERVANKLDAKKIFKQLGKDPAKLLAVSNISAKEVKEFLSDEKLDKCIHSTTVSKYLKTSKVKK